MTFNSIMCICWYVCVWLIEITLFGVMLNDDCLNYQIFLATGNFLSPFTFVIIVHHLLFSLVG